MYVSFDVASIKKKYLRSKYIDINYTKCTIFQCLEIFLKTNVETVRKIPIHKTRIALWLTLLSISFIFFRKFFS